MISLFNIVVATALVSVVQQGSEKPKLVEVTPKKVYTPKGFDSNDTAQFVVEGEFSSSCYRVKDVKVAPPVKDENIVFKVIANQYAGPCVQVTTPYLIPVDVEVLEEGAYPVWNTKIRDRAMGVLAIHLTDSTKRDDFDYAAVDSAVIFYDSANERSVLTLFGTHKNSCTRFDKEKFYMRPTASDMLEVLPILKQVEGENCKDGDYPFRENFVIPETIPVGRYLLYIRTADGQSFTKIDFIKKPKEDDSAPSQ